MRAGFTIVVIGMDGISAGYRFVRIVLYGGKPSPSSAKSTMHKSGRSNLGKSFIWLFVQFSYGLPVKQMLLLMCI